MESLATPKFRVSYPNVFKPRLNDLNGKEEYSLVALFPKGADLSKLEQAAQEAAEKKWGKGKIPKGIRSPFRDQSEREKDGVLPEGHEAGAKFLNLKSNRRPGLVDKKVQPIIDESEFYAGCYALATIGAYAYEQKGNRGVAFGLRNIQKLGEGDPLSSFTRPEDDFKPIAEDSSDSIFT